MFAPWLPLTQRQPDRSWYDSVSHDVSICVLALYVLAIWSIFV